MIVANASGGWRRRLALVTGLVAVAAPVLRAQSVRSLRLELPARLLHLGAFAYHCVAHPFMKATVIVQ